MEFVSKKNESLHFALKKSLEQPTYPPITLTSSSTNEELWSEIKLLNNRVEYLESELELYKNPEPEADERQAKNQQPRKKRKTMPFSRLLTDEPQKTEKVQKQEIRKQKKEEKERKKVEQQRIREENQVKKKSVQRKVVLPDYMSCAIIGHYLDDHNFQYKLK
ncbi:25006_t:CDS:2 [Dentiscutata erythropus]|uniref:25006_t:CDS:1 n=1 Tax=Dentiscutata erythropus TaxID=1348616 RepID=A0A9N8WUP9_9GLOM|nr:25006_t:CDS:2 [Dentiscutata erythropus]